jgi:hypothetical protein
VIRIEVVRIVLILKAMQREKRWKRKKSAHDPCPPGVVDGQIESSEEG